MTDHNEPAFPVLFPGQNDVPDHYGLTKREYAAIEAMQALMSRGDIGVRELCRNGEEYEAGLARAARKAADALMAELAKEPTNG